MTPEKEPLRGLPSHDQVPSDLERRAPGPEGENHTPVIQERRRPLRAMAGRAAADLDAAACRSLVTYWASVAPAAFLLALEAFEQDTRW